MFEWIDIAESIYEGVLETSYKQYTREDYIHAGHRSKKKGEANSSHTYSVTSESADNCRKIYVDHPKGESKTCLIHGPEH